jgi:DNA-directed RNA polymerase specialized sigma24 family protein
LETILNERLSYSDSELFDMILHKNNFVYDIVYNSYSGVIYGVILQSTQLKIYAEEIFEIAFCNIWKNIDHYNSEIIKFTTYIVRILIQTIKDFLSSKLVRYNLVHTGGNIVFHLDRQI